MAWRAPGGYGPLKDFAASCAFGKLSRLTGPRSRASRALEFAAGGAPGRGGIADELVEPLRLMRR
jgi:hypothetical protein